MPTKFRAMGVGLALAAALACVNTATAEPPPGKGGGKKQEGDQREAKGKGKGKDASREEARRDDRGSDRAAQDRDAARSSGKTHSSSGRPADARTTQGAASWRFEANHRVIVRDYYVNDFRSGHCPPGLAKKRNGCMPPGQAKKWRTGHPLPRDVIYYDLPPALVVQIGVPPPGYKFVRVAADILLIAIGTGMVIDAITDLGNL